jgi:cardiolipin synthase (CMP-forming)
MVPAWLPNALSMTRIALVPAWLALAVTERARALDGEDARRLPVVLLLLVLGATDMIDGQLARRFHLESNFGATLDATADKLATFAGTTFLAFFAAPAFTPVPWWLWLALLVRDMLLGVGYLAVWLRHRAVHVEHRWHGRLGTLVLFGVVVAATAKAPPVVVTLGALTAFALVVPGTVAYMREGWRQLTTAG